MISPMLVRNALELESAIAAAAGDPDRGLFVFPDSLPVVHRALIIELDPQDGTPSCHHIRLTCSHASVATRSRLRAQRAPA
jgi:hypothetical protein